MSLACFMLVGVAGSCSKRERQTTAPAGQMDEYRWVVDQVKVAMELPGDVSVIHPSLLRAKNGDLLLFGNSYPGNRFKAKTYDVFLSRSADHGTTWSQPGKVFTEPLPGGLKPTWVQGGATLKSGRLVLIGGFGSTESPPDTTTMQATGRDSPYGFPVLEVRGRWRSVGETGALFSDDDGKTWQVSQPIDVMSYAPGGPVAELSDGTLLLPVYGYRRGAAEDEQISNGYVKSPNGGSTWSAPTTVAYFDKQLQDLPNEMAIVELTARRWVAFYRNQFFRKDYGNGGLYLYRSYSNDGGKTWSLGQQVFSGLGYTAARLLPDGALIVIGVDGNNGIRYAVSNNGGAAWDYHNALWNYDGRAGGDAGGFSTVDLPDGRVLVAYYAKADLSQRLKSAFEYGKMRLELAWLKKVPADSVPGRMR